MEARSRRIALALVTVAGMLGMTGMALAGTPVVASVTEAEAGGTEGYVLLLAGVNLTKVTSFELRKTDGTTVSALTVRLATKNLAALDLPSVLTTPAYELPGDFTLVYTHRAGQGSVNVRIAMGNREATLIDENSLDPAFRADLDDAVTVGGQTPAQLRNASSISSGTLDPQRFSAYDDLVQESKVGPGATQVAAGNHNHDSVYLSKTEAGTTYVQKAGDTLSGKLTISSSTECVSASSSTTSTTAGALDATASSGVAVSGHGDIGVLGDLDSDGTFGVYGRSMNASQVAVYGYAYDSTSIGVSAYNWADGVAVQGKGWSGIGVYGFDVSDGIGVKAACTSNGVPFLADLQYYYGDIAVFQYYGSNVARISYFGAGYFNGGVYTSGADFAEVVKVDRSAASFGPGDVLVIDAAAERGFRLSSSPQSALVAGVYSTQPGVLGSRRPVAGDAVFARDEVPLAVVGIVPTKVCDEGGAIRPGDLLVTSGVPGRAMRAGPDPPRGSVLGKALGTLRKGTGVIEVLLGPGR